MQEFTSEVKPTRPNTFLYALGIFLVAAVGLLLYGRFHKSASTGDPAESTTVPGLVRAGNPNFEYYKDRVRLSDVRAQLGINYAKSRIAIITGMITNEGDRKLEALEIHIS